MWYFHLCNWYNMCLQLLRNLSYLNQSFTKNRPLKMLLHHLFIFSAVASWYALFSSFQLKRDFCRKIYTKYPFLRRIFRLILKFYFVRILGIFKIWQTLTVKWWPFQYWTKFEKRSVFLPLKSYFLEFFIKHDCSGVLELHNPNQNGFVCWISKKVIQHFNSPNCYKNEGCCKKTLDKLCKTLL